MLRKRWPEFPPPLPAQKAAAFQHLHPILAAILYNRGYTDPAAANTFLKGDMLLGDPFKMRGMAQAVARIRRAIKNKERIVVYGDFDADGVTSTTLLVTTLEALGANVKPYIPHRVDEGYGLNAAALQTLAHKGIKLVITVDCGIRSLYEAQVGRDCGLDMIITDHHSVGPQIPEAVAVINPKQPGCAYPEKMLAGVGIAYKLADALLRVAREQDRRDVGWTADALLDLVAIGTVADLAPLNHAENRALVIKGLQQLHQPRRIGVRALLEVASLDPEKVTSTTIGFIIGPRINAAGRLESAMLAYEMLSTNDLQAAMTRAQELQTLNEKRQQLTREAQEFVKMVVGLDTMTDVPLIFAIDPGFQQGIVGLVAGRLTEEYYRPAIVMHKGEQESHGSCRSINELNITEALDQCADLLLRHGGHAQAAGFAIHNDNLPLFQERITEIVAEELQGKDLQPTIRIDAKVPWDMVDEQLYNALLMLEPCGQDNASPVLATTRLKVVSARTVGRDNSHLRLRLSDGKIERDAIAFRMGELAEAMPPYVDIAYQLDMDEWNGSRTLQVKVQDIRSAS